MGGHSIAGFTPPLGWEGGGWGLPYKRMRVVVRNICKNLSKVQEHCFVGMAQIHFSPKRYQF